MSKKSHVSLSNNEEFRKIFLWDKELDDNCVFITASNVEKKKTTKNVSDSKSIGE